MRHAAHRRLLLVAFLLTVLAVILVFQLPAWAHHVTDGGVDEPWIVAMNQETYWEARFGGECTKFENHSGSIPSSYEAAVVKDGNYVRVYNPLTVSTVLGAVNPANNQHFGAPHSWIMKCDLPQTTTTTVDDTTTTTETTTSSSITTTTQPNSTTSSSIPETTTTTAVVTTTAPGETTTTSRLEALWTASASCDRLVAEWGEGIVQVDVWMRAPDGDLGPADGLVPFTVSGQELRTGANAEWILIPVVVNGYTAVPEEIVLFTERCEEPTSTVAPTSSVPTDSTLPFTGPMENVTLLGFSAVALIVLGWMVLREARR